VKVYADCRYFDGYKPCRYGRPCTGCPHYDRPANRVLLVNLDALGDVLRTTALLGPLHREISSAHVTWLTLPQAVPLLDHVPGIDRVVPLTPWTATLLQTLRFDLVLGVDKSLAGGSLTLVARARERRGFGLDEHGSIIPLSPSAAALYRLGLDDRDKFVDNRKPETRLLSEAMGWTWRRDPYRVVLSDTERAAVRSWREAHGIRGGDIAVGFNTGSSAAYPDKHLGAAAQARLIDLIAEAHPGAALILLGGPEDTQRNGHIASLTTVRRPLESPTDEGLRRGLQMVAACDLVVTGDSLGMHMAIGLGKPVVAWFGLSCHQEIDLYGRGVWVLADVDCRPCWRRTCAVEPRCTERVPLDRMAEHTGRIIEALADGEAWQGEILVGPWPTWPTSRAGPIE
jgi:heptosyltransferase-2